MSCTQTQICLQAPPLGIVSSSYPIVICDDLPTVFLVIWNEFCTEKQGIKVPCVLEGGSQVFCEGIEMAMDGIARKEAL
jgi:hypothetical protein